MPTFLTDLQVSLIPVNWSLMVLQGPFHMALSLSLYLTLEALIIRNFIIIFLHFIRYPLQPSSASTAATDITAAAITVTAVLKRGQYFVTRC